MHVLLVEDDPDYEQILAAMLRAAGHTVNVATPREALAAIPHGGFDLLATDVFLPDVDGTELVRAARKHNPTLPILAISGGTERLSAHIGLRMTEALGASATLYKPFSADELAAAVAAALQGRPAAI